MLEMKPSCLMCEAMLAPGDDAAICSHECTYCHRCALSLSNICKNCGGELVVRPKRNVKEVTTGPALNSPQ